MEKKVGPEHMFATTLTVCENVTKRYPRFELGPVDLSVERGRVTGLFGPNGSGKTTLLSLILRLVRPTSGRIVIDNHSIQISAVLESLGMLPDLAVKRYLETTSKLHGSSIDVAEVADYCGIERYLDTRIRHLSMGNRQRTAIACLLLSEAPFVVFDEPLNGLDPEGIQWFAQVLRDMKSQGHAIILSSHLLTEAQSLIDDCVFLSEGEVIYSGSLATVEELARHSLRIRREDSIDPSSDLHRHIIFRENGMAYLDGPNDFNSYVQPEDGWADSRRRIPLAAIYAWLLHGSYETAEQVSCHA